MTALEEAINDCVDRIAYLTDEDFHGYRSEVWLAIAKVARFHDAELARLREENESIIIEGKKVYDIYARIYRRYMEIGKQNERLRGALQWYVETVGDCNRTGNDGDTARNRLAKDHGTRAREALTTEQGGE